ncbi:hypothetical protein [Verrucosispora sp. TAA-831]|uniref:hypothetical protein n=1 Tax=Verrucosispora sp. TAA-831 TaxID=3422227 RepID=UPI003D6DF5EB
MTLIVGVHGIAKHHSGRHQLLADWRPALLDGVERATGRRVDHVDLDLAFYGDLYLPPRTSGGCKGNEEADALDGLSDEERADVEEMLSEMVTPEDVAAATAYLAGEKGYTRMPTPLQVLLRALGIRFRSASAITAVGALRQVRGYLRDVALKAEIDQRVTESVTSGCRVLVGHSLGSVVAAEYLRRTPDHGVALLLTLGSPLGLRFVRSRFPASSIDVPTWVNIRDRRDPVASAGSLRPWWPQIAEADDILVENGADTHAVERYLSRRATGEVLIRAVPELVGREWRNVRQRLGEGDDSLQCHQTPSQPG